MRCSALLLLVSAALVGCATVPSGPTADELRSQVESTERAFARTMVDRDHDAFVSFLADEAVFLGKERTLRGKREVAERWKRYYKTPEPPFSWEPDRVEVLDSGTLAITAGPVRAPDGKLSGRFSSIWRLDGPGQWRIIFDKGEDVCEESRRD